MHHGRKPILPVLLIICVIGAIYFVASGDNSALGQSTPISMKKNWTADSGVPSKNQESSQDTIKTEVKSPVPDTEAVEQDLSGYTDAPFMAKMANETLKAKLGNSAWHLMHTVLARYPDKPTEQEKNTLKLFIHFFAQVYPCGDCARHFLKLLAKYPPQVSSRKTAAMWGCHIHNKVNERLEKPEYDCTTILEDYDCGCGSDEKEADPTLGDESLSHLRGMKVDDKKGQELGG